MRLFEVLHYLQEQEGSIWKSNPTRALCGSVQSAHREHFEGFPEHGTFFGITNGQENKPLNIIDKNGLSEIKWE